MTASQIRGLLSLKMRQGHDAKDVLLTSMFPVKFLKRK